MDSSVTSLTPSRRDRAFQKSLYTPHKWNIFNIPEMIFEIMKQIDDPSTFLSSLQVNKEWYAEGKRLIQQKKTEFIKHIYELSRDNSFLHVISSYPNRTKHGEERVFLASTLSIPSVPQGKELKEIGDQKMLYDSPLVIRFWEEGKLNGPEVRYDSKGEFCKETAWLNGRKDGEEYEYSWYRLG